MSTSKPETLLYCKHYRRNVGEIFNSTAITQRTSVSVNYNVSVGYNLSMSLLCRASQMYVLLSFPLCFSQMETLCTLYSEIELLQRERPWPSSQHLGQGAGAPASPGHPHSPDEFQCSVQRKA